MIELREVGYRVGERWLIERVSLTVRPGELVALVGPNGAGKSTLLRLASGELRPHRGGVFFDGAPLSSVGGRALARRRAVQDQEPAGDFPIEVVEVVLLGRAPHGEGEQASLRAAHDAMERVGVGALSERLLPTLSGGERKRAHAARALAQIAGVSPAALLLDEPVAALDPCHQHRLLRLASDEAARGAAVLCVLHELNLAAQYASRIVALDRGRVVADGTPAAVLHPSLLADLFAVEAEVHTLPSLRWPLIVTRGPLGPARS